MKTVITNQADLERLIERYFDGETTLQQEHDLRAALATCQWSSETIDEARFAMGYFAAHAQQQRGSLKSAKKHAVAIAASIAVLLAIGGFALWHNHQANNVCVAYVNGYAINDDDQVMSLIKSDLDNIDAASQGMTAQLSSLSDALELDNE